MGALPEVDAELLRQAGLAVALSFLIGLELHNYRRSEGEGLGFGTVRTLTLLGAAGFVLAALEPSRLLFCLGLATLALWLAVYYRQRLKEGRSSLISPLVALLAYVLGLVVQEAPPWFAAGYAVFIIFLLNAKPSIRSFADTVSGQEIATVAKFVIMAGIVLPLLPDRQIAAFVPVTFRQTWFAVVAVSGISYLSYVLRRYVFKSRGTLAAGVLGGLYSSTATTVVLAHKAREAPDPLVSPALMLATAMMYVRLLTLAAVLAPASLQRLTAPFAVAALASVAAAALLLRLRPVAAASAAAPPEGHPLEFQVALLFAVLFVVFATATAFVVGRYSGSGLMLLAFGVGFTEIDPFVLSVLSGHLTISLHAAVDAVVIAAASNNLLKAGVALVMARNASVRAACAWLCLLAAASFLYVLL